MSEHYRVYLPGNDTPWEIDAETPTQAATEAKAQLQEWMSNVSTFVYDSEGNLTKVGGRK